VNPEENRVLSKVAMGDCWEWLASFNTDGYGAAWYENKQQQAHRAVYKILVGPIPEGMQLDHLCNNRSCVNPNHLEVVDAWENNFRSQSFTAKNIKKTHCIHGHEFTDENTYIHPQRGHRHCRACQNKRKGVGDSGQA
jgi:hypothetical protein